jgi:hypothetical protein
VWSSSTTQPYPRYQTQFHYPSGKDSLPALDWKLGDPKTGMDAVDRSESLVLTGNKSLTPRSSGS